MEKIKPFGKRVLVKRLEPKQVSDGGIFIPTDARERPVYGIVRALGKDAPAWIKNGDVVLFGKYSGVDILVGDEPLLILKEEELFGEVVDQELIQKYLTEGV